MLSKHHLSLAKTNGPMPHTHGTSSPHLGGTYHFTRLAEYRSTMRPSGKVICCPFRSGPTTGSSFR